MSRKIIYLFSAAVLMFAGKMSISAQESKAASFNTPPSCVITAPHVNAYFRQGNQVRINAYARDIGGSGPDGEVALVEFYVDGHKIGACDTAVNNYFSIDWEAPDPGEYRIHALARDTAGLSFTSAGVLITVGTEKVKLQGLSSGKGKYLASNVSNLGIEPSFLDYWNGVTSGNGGKWQTVEGTRDVMNWHRGDQAYDLARDHYLPYRYHTFAWGSQYPAWITSLEPAEFQEEMEEFIAAAAARYPYVDQIDVINEALPGHQAATQYFIDGLGGEGESGYDWAVWMFKKAREYFPNAKLVLNDFGIVNSRNNILNTLPMLKVLRDSGLVDGFGAQAHHFSLDKVSSSVLRSNLDLMASAGVPIYITEMDMRGSNGDDATQLASYRGHFPVLWEHPDVAGITLWGYVYDRMWVADAGLIYQNGEERPAMDWLKQYMADQPTVGYPFLDTLIAVETLLINSPVPDSIVIGDTLQLKASLLPEEATPQPVFWSSDQMSVASITPQGILVARKEGRVTITASCSGKSANHVLHVIDTVTQLKFMFEAELYKEHSGGWTESSTDEGGGLLLAYLAEGDWASYEMDVDRAGIYDFRIRAATRSTGGRIEISIMDSVLNTAYVEDERTDDWDDWYTTDPVEIELEEGLHELKLSFFGSDHFLFHLNWFEINFNRVAGGVLDTTSIQHYAEDTDLALEVYPNPFSNVLHLSYALTTESAVDIEILELGGRLLASLVSEGSQQPGTYMLSWDGTGMASGIYVLRTRVNNGIRTRKIILNK